MCIQGTGEEARVFGAWYRMRLEKWAGVAVVGWNVKACQDTNLIFSLV